MPSFKKSLRVEQFKGNYLNFVQTDNVSILLSLFFSMYKKLIKLRLN